MRDNGFGGQEPSPFVSIPMGFYWSITTSTTTGYGDIFPTSLTGRMVALISMFCSMIVLALPISVIGGNFNIMFDSLATGIERPEKTENTRRKTEKIINLSISIHVFPVKFQIGTSDQVVGSVLKLVEYHTGIIEDPSVDDQLKALRRNERDSALILVAEKMLLDNSKKERLRRIVELQFKKSAFSGMKEYSDDLANLACSGGAIDFEAENVSSSEASLSGFDNAGSIEDIILKLSISINEIEKKIKK